MNRIGNKTSLGLGMLLSVVLVLALTSGASGQDAVPEVAVAEVEEIAIPAIWWVAPVMSLFALVMAWVMYRQVIAAPEGDERMKEIDDAMNYFWDCLDGVPGLRAHRPPREENSTMGGWYAAHGKYVPEELDGLSLTRFCQAVTAEGCPISPGANKPLHLHPLLNTCDVYGHGKPTRIANTDRDVRQPPGSLPVTERMIRRVYSIPWFKKNNHALIDEYVEAFRKASANYKELLADDPGDPPDVGNWHFFQHTG